MQSHLKILKIQDSEKHRLRLNSQPVYQSCNVSVDVKLMCDRDCFSGDGMAGLASVPAQKTSQPSSAIQKAMEATLASIELPPLPAKIAAAAAPAAAIEVKQER